MSEFFHTGTTTCCGITQEFDDKDAVCIRCGQSFLRNSSPNKFQLMIDNGNDIDIFASSEEALATVLATKEGVCKFKTASGFVVVPLNRIDGFKLVK